MHILKMRILIMQVWSMQENSQTQDDSNVIQEPIKCKSRKLGESSKDQKIKTLKGD